MKKPTVLITLLLLLCIVILGFWIVSSMDAQNTTPPVFTIPGHSIVISSGDSTGLELSQGFRTASYNYGPIQIPAVFSTKTTDSGAFTLLSFAELHPESWNNLTLSITLYGHSYTAEMTSVSPSFIVFGDPDGIRTMYKGTITGLPNSRIELLITDTNMISGAIYLVDDCIYISPVQNREYGQNTTNPLHVAYSDRELPWPSYTPMPIDRH